MPAPRHWLEEPVRQVIANHPDWSSAKILAFLEERVRSAGYDPEALDKRERLPDVRTIDRIRRRFPMEEHSPYREVRWPDTFAAGLLPWEAAPLALKIMRNTPKRPLIRNVLWTLRLQQARPDETTAICWDYAGYMAAWEVNPEANKNVPEQVERWLLTGERISAAIFSPPSNDLSGQNDLLSALVGMNFDRKGTDGKQEKGERNATK